MSNLEMAPTEHRCVRADEGGVLRQFPGREVPLGGVRGVTVTRLLPQRALPLIGAWCFLDVFGPERVPMRVLPHPHTGLQTVTWPLAGEIRHRDSLGSDVVIEPGQLNLMTSGAGIAHSEFSVSASGAVEMSHGVQLWVALPAAEAAGASRFEQHRDLPVYRDGGLTATVFVGELSGARSPALVHTPLLGADITVARETTVAVPVQPDFEYGVFVLSGEVEVCGEGLAVGSLLYVGPGRDSLPLASLSGAHVVLLGGTPFPDELVMWWNFVGRSHEEVAQARRDWEAGSPRFGPVAGHGSDRIPAPPMPDLRLTPRRRRL